MRERERERKREVEGEGEGEGEKERERVRPSKHKFILQPNKLGANLTIFLLVEYKNEKKNRIEHF
jgi:hypothetical protein